MKQIFDFLENTDLSATVCDKDGIVVYRNTVAIKNDGNAIGKIYLTAIVPRLMTKSKQCWKPALKTSMK